jgi:hypothetical protein
MSEKFRTPYDLPTRFESESGKHIENEFLFGLYEYMFSNRKPIFREHPISKYFITAYLEGFPNHIEPTVPEKSISHDQLTAYICMAELFHLEGTELINKNIKGLKYTALGQEVTLHPRDYLYYRLLNKSMVGFLGLPIIYLLAMFSLFVGFRLNKYDVDRPQNIFRINKYVIQKKLSGELLYILKVFCVKDDFILKICMYPVKIIVRLGAKIRYGSVENMVKRYFMDKDDHPVVRGFNFKF